jgi:hypothetical protein
MLFKAISLGYAVPQGDFDAQIHSVFRSSVNLDAEGEDGLLTLTCSPSVDLPQGIRLGAAQRLDLSDLHPGARACCRDGILTFHATPWGVDLRKSHRWRCDLARMNINQADPAVALAWDRAWSELDDRQRSAKSEIVVGKLFRADLKTGSRTARRAGRAVRKLVRATHQVDPAAYQAAEALIGLGAGLTPSGDDLLVGYLAGLWCTLRDMSARQRFLAGLARVVSNRSVNTNDIGRTYLLHAARGQVSSPLEATARAIGRGDPQDRIHRHIGLAARLGHASGLEGLTGLLLGLAAWDGSLVM